MQLNDRTVLRKALAMISSVCQSILVLLRSETLHSVSMISLNLESELH